MTQTRKHILHPHSLALREPRGAFKVPFNAGFLSMPLVIKHFSQTLVVTIRFLKIWYLVQSA